MKRNIAQAESEIKQSQQGYRAYQNRPVKTPADEALDTELNQRFQAYITGMQPMLKYAKNGMFEAIINHESEQIRTLDNAYTDILNKAVKIRSTRANQLAELAHQRTRLGGMFMIGAFVLALVMTLITFMVLRRIVIRPLQHAAQRIEKIASGDLTMKDEPAGRNEIGRLSLITANAAFTGDDRRDCSTGCGRDLSWHQRNFSWQCGPVISHRRTSGGYRTNCRQHGATHCDGETECG